MILTCLQAAPHSVASSCCLWADSSSVRLQNAQCLDEVLIEGTTTDVTKLMWTEQSVHRSTLNQSLLLFSISLPIYFWLHKNAARTNPPLSSLSRMHTSDAPARVCFICIHNSVRKSARRETFCVATTDHWHRKGESVHRSVLFYVEW